MQVGDTIAGYEIVAKLKAGGMAALFLGRRQGAAGFAKHVAIKVVHDHLADDEGFVKMFLDEARITARIEHPNVVHVHDLGLANNHYFLVMEYVPSVSLTQLMRAVAKLGRRLSPEVATWIAMQIAAGLHAAHETTDDEGNPLGIVHRDVSPKNVLVAFKGYVKVIDFGIAKAAGRATKTTGGMLKGTFRYMSPEQARGRELDHRSDLYTLGIVLWEMLMMRRLFDAPNDLALLDMVREPEVVSPGRLISVPKALDKALMKALSKDPEQRPANCDEFRMMLASAVPGALRITAKQVAELIGASMAEKINVDHDPSVASALGKPVTVQVPASVLDKMTRSPDAILIDGAAALQPTPIVVTPTGQIDPTSGIVPTMVTPTPSHPGLESIDTSEAITLERGKKADKDKPDLDNAVTIELTVDNGAPDTIPAPRRPNRLPLIAAVAALVVGIGIGSIWVFSGESTPVVESLEPNAPMEPAETEPETVAQVTAVEETAEPVIEPEVEQPEEPEVEQAPEVAIAQPEVDPEPVAEMVTMTSVRSEMRTASMRNTMRSNNMRRRTSMTDDPLVVGW